MAKNLLSENIKCSLEALKSFTKAYNFRNDSFNRRLLVDIDFKRNIIVLYL